ncbi:hypothetical protein [Persephonella sp.]
MAETIIPDNSGGQESLKLNLKNIFTFLSSLDYIRAIEKSSAFRYIDSSQLFFIGERQSLILFVYTHTSFWVLVAYIFMIISAHLILGIDPIYAILGISIAYLISGLWFVYRYTWGNGYLWQIVKSFMLNLTISAFVISVVIDITVLYLIPSIYDAAVKWLNSGSKEGPLNQLGHAGIQAVVEFIQPLMDKYMPEIKKYTVIYMIASPLKVIAFAVPTIVMFYLHRLRKDPKKRLNKILVKIA